MPLMAVPINHAAEPGFGSAGAALMAAMMAHRAQQSQAAGYQHPPSHPPAHMVGRPGDSELQPPPHRRRHTLGAPLRGNLTPGVGMLG